MVHLVMWIVCVFGFVVPSEAAKSSSEKLAIALAAQLSASANYETCFGSPVDADTSIAISEAVRKHYFVFF